MTREQIPRAGIRRVRRTVDVRRARPRALITLLAADLLYRLALRAYVRRAIGISR